MIKDIWGDLWAIEELRPTSHHFEIALGRPVGYGPQGRTVILTPALAHYLQGVERPRDLDLPISRSTLTTLRRQLGLGFDAAAWWRAREDDLRSMTLDAFAAKHRCSTGAASQRRAALTTKKAATPKDDGLVSGA